MNPTGLQGREEKGNVEKDVKKKRQNHLQEKEAQQEAKLERRNERDQIRVGNENQRLDQNVDQRRSLQLWIRKSPKDGDPKQVSNTSQIN